MDQAPGLVGVTPVAPSISDAGLTNFGVGVTEREGVLRGTDVGAAASLSAKLRGSNVPPITPEKTGLFSRLFPSSATYHPYYMANNAELTTLFVQGANLPKDVQEQRKQVIGDIWQKGYVISAGASVFRWAIAFVIALIFLSIYVLAPATKNNTAITTGGKWAIAGTSLLFIMTCYRAVQWRMIAPGEALDKWLLFTADFNARADSGSTAGNLLDRGDAAVKAQEAADAKPGIAGQVARGAAAVWLLNRLRG